MRAAGSRQVAGRRVAAQENQSSVAATRPARLPVIVAQRDKWSAAAGTPVRGAWRQGRADGRWQWRRRQDLDTPAIPPVSARLGAPAALWHRRGSAGVHYWHS